VDLSRESYSQAFQREGPVMLREFFALRSGRSSLRLAVGRRTLVAGRFLSKDFFGVACR
jgi:hypothetical protein